MESLTNSEKKILEELFFWNYDNGKATPFFISKKSKFAESTVIKGLRNLKYLKLITKSMGGSWYISSDKKEELSMYISHGEQYEHEKIIKEIKKN